MKNIKIRSDKRIGPINEDILSIIIGSLLGDSFVEKRNQYGTRITFKQCNANKEYLFWIHKYLADRGYCSNKIPIMEKLIGKKGKIYYSYIINTYTYTSLNYIYNLFYEKNIKIIPSNIEEYLTPLALAIWIQDDGGKNSAGLTIHTNCFKQEEVELLCKVLNNKYNLEANIRLIGILNQFIIYIPKRSMTKLSLIIKPYMVESMYYKIKGN